MSFHNLFSVVGPWVFAWLGTIIVGAWAGPESPGWSHLGLGDARPDIGLRRRWQPATLPWGLETPPHSAILQGIHLSLPLLRPPFLLGG